MGRVADHLTEPGRWVRRSHATAHWLWARGHRTAAKVVALLCRFATGADVHPGALVGRGLMVCHGMGLVIGEGARLGDGCQVLQGVTIGSRGGAGMPSIGNDVLIGANAVLLGAIAVGDGAQIGAGAVVLQDVPARWTAVGNPARLLPPKGERSALKGRQPFLEARDGG